MPKQRKISTLVGIIIIVIAAVVIFGGVFVYQYFVIKKQSEFQLPQNQNQAEQAVGWKTYSSAQYGFEFKYPTTLKVVSSGPNDIQQAINKGEQVSGTVQPSYETITLSDKFKTVGIIEIFDTYEKGIAKENYQDGYLYLYGPCDVRWGFNPESFNLNQVNGIKILAVKGKDQNSIYQSCNYFKNQNNNLIDISNNGYKQDIFNQILSTFKFTNN